MRSVSISFLPKTERVSDVSPVKQTREETLTKRVRDVKQVEKRTKKHPRLFRVRRKSLSFQQQRQFARMLNSYQLQALRNWQGFSDSIADVTSLNDAQRFILQSAQHSSHLYPAALRSQIIQYVQSAGLSGEEKALDSGGMQQLIAYESHLDGLLSLLALCRNYDAREREVEKHRPKVKHD